MAIPSGEKKLEECTNVTDRRTDGRTVTPRDGKGSGKNKKCITVAYIDFSCAFDSISLFQKKLLARLYAYGIQGYLLRWLKHFVVGRTQQLKLVYTYLTLTLSDGTQGSGIGLLMFSVYNTSMTLLNY